MFQPVEWSPFFPDHRSSVPATDSDISDLEDYLSVKLPEDYRAFLQQFNGGRFNKVDFSHFVDGEDDRISGFFCADNTHAQYSVEFETRYLRDLLLEIQGRENCRKITHEGIDLSVEMLVCTGHTPSDDFIYLDTRTGEVFVIYFDYLEIHKLCDSFLQFFNSLREHEPTNYRL